MHLVEPVDVTADNILIGTQTGESNQNSSSQGVKSSAENPAANRQIIYNAEVLVEVSDLDRLTENLNVQLKDLGGFVATYDERRNEGVRSVAIWTIRVDATKFFDLLKWLDGEANVVRKKISSREVTEEFVDLSSRLTNKKATEKRLTAMLEERSGKLEDLLTIEKEIDRTRENIEKIEGRLRLLNDQTALSTVTLTASTRVDYVAPKPANLATTLSETWAQSAGQMQEACKWLLIGLVGVIPWLPIVAVLGGIGWFAKEKIWR